MAQRVIIVLPRFWPIPQIPIPQIPIPQIPIPQIPIPQILITFPYWEQWSTGRGLGGALPSNISSHLNQFAIYTMIIIIT